MFQFLRRVSGSLLPRPDRPWRDDATSHAPTMGRKRRHSVIEQDISDSATVKRTKNDTVKPDTECDSGSEEESSEGAVIPPVEGQDVKEVTKGVKEVDLEDTDKAEEESIRPEGVPLPDSPSGSPEPESESSKPDAVDEENLDDKHSIASSSPEDHPDVADDRADSVMPNANTSADEITPDVLLDVPDTLEVVA